MFCDQCGAQIAEGMRFCENCGAAVPDDQEEEHPQAGQSFCLSCGAPLVAGEAFCTRCGTPIGQAGQNVAVDRTSVMPSVSGAPVEAGKQKSSKTLTIVIIVLIVALLAIGGFIGWQIYKDKQGAASSSETPAATTTSNTGGASSTSSTNSGGTSSSSTTSQTGSSGTSTTGTSTTGTSTTTSSNPYIQANPGDYVFSDSSSRYLSESELTSLSKEKLRIARNEIFARNGREFNDNQLKEYFTSKSWYRPSIAADDFDVNIESRLNSYEYANVNLIKQVEEDKGYL